MGLFGKRKHNDSGVTEICPICGNPSAVFRDGAKFDLGRICIGCYEACERAAEMETAYSRAMKRGGHRRR